MQDRDVFVRCLAEKLLIYSLGRGLERYDKPTLAEITAKLPIAGLQVLANWFWQS